MGDTYVLTAEEKERALKSALALRERLARRAQQHEEEQDVEQAGDDDDLCEWNGCQNQATHTESWYDEEGVDARVCDEHE